MDILIINKIGAIAVMLFLALSVCLLPVQLRKVLMRRSTLSQKCTTITLSAFLCFGAGILMAIVFLHILTEVREGFQSMMKDKLIQDVEYPLAEVILCSGFFLFYLLEEITHLCVGHHSHSSSSLGSSFVEDTKVNSGKSPKEMLDIDVNQINGKEKDCEQWKNVYVTSIESSHSHSSEINNGNSVEAGLPSHDDICHPPCPSEEYEDDEQLSLIRSLMIVVALSLHGAFEGLALGLEKTCNDVWLLCIALSSHKVFIGFSIGMELLEIGIKKSVYCGQIVVFSLASPLGAIVGMTLREAIESQDTLGRMVIGILEGLSGGAILYVTFCEILERERMKPVGRFVRMLALMAGFSIMAALIKCLGHNDDDQLYTEMPFITNGTVNHYDSKHLLLE